MIRAEACEAIEVLHILKKLKSEKTDRQNKVSLDGILKQGKAFKITDCEKIIGAFVLQKCGAEMWIMAAVGKSKKCDLTVKVIQVAERAARIFGCECTALRTERQGLLKKAIGLGYSIYKQDSEAFFLKKKSWN